MQYVQASTLSVGLLNEMKANRELSSTSVLGVTAVSGHEPNLHQ